MWLEVLDQLFCDCRLLRPHRIIDTAPKRRQEPFLVIHFHYLTVTEPPFDPISIIYLELVVGRIELIIGLE